MSGSEVIRPLVSLAELRAAVALQEEVWGRGFSEKVPASIQKIAARLGGVAAGAFDDDALVGFVFGITGIEGGRPVHWSHMLAVLPGREGRNLGRRLKAYQRERLLERGVTRMYWTFDPLESRNGWFNLVRLGAVATEYIVDMYGDTDSPRHRGIGTDRFLALWEMDSPRVRDRLDPATLPPDPLGGRDHAALPRAFEVEMDGAHPRPAGHCRIPPERPYLVPLPRSIQEVIAADPERGRIWREATRAALAPALDTGDVVRALVRLDDATTALVVEAP